MLLETYENFHRNLQTHENFRWHTYKLMKTIKFILTHENFHWKCYKLENKNFTWNSFKLVKTLPEILSNSWKLSLELLQTHENLHWTVLINTPAIILNVSNFSSHLLRPQVTLQILPNDKWLKYVLSEDHSKSDLTIHHQGTCCLTHHKENSANVTVKLNLSNTLKTELCFTIKRKLNLLIPLKLSELRKSAKLSEYYLWVNETLQNLTIFYQNIHISP